MESNQISLPVEELSEKKRPVEEQKCKEEPFWKKNWDELAEHRIK